MQDAAVRSLSLGMHQSGSLARWLIVSGVLLVASVLVQLGIRMPETADAARWPTEDSFFQVDGWRVSPADVETAPARFRVVNRTYSGAHGATVYLALWTSPDAKRIYRADATVPFVNAGYTIDAAPTDLVPPAPHRDVLLFHDSSRQFLELHVYGERRGSFGTGPVAWGLAGFDTLLGNANDYYLIRLIAPLDGDSVERAQEAAALADTLVAHLAAWYAAA